MWAATYRGWVQTSDATFGSGDSFYNKYFPAVLTALTVTGGTTTLNGSTVEGYRGIFVDPSGAFASIILSGASVSTHLNILSRSLWAAVALNGAGAYAEINDSIITGNGNNTHGVLASDFARAVIQNSSVTANGLNAYGLYAENGGEISVTGGSVTANGLNAYGLYAENGGVISMTGGSVTANGGGGYGVKAEGSGSIVGLTDTTVTTNGVDAYGLYAENGGEISMTGGSVTANAAYGHAVVAEGSDSDVGLTDTTVTTNGVDAYGLYAENGGTVDMSGGFVSTLGVGSHAVWSSGGGSEITIENIAVYTTGIGDNSLGLYSYGLYADNGGTVDMSGGSVSTAGALSHAVRSSGSGSEIYLLDDVSVSTEGAGAYGLYADDGGYIQKIGSSVSTVGDSSHAVVAEAEDSLISISNADTVSTTGISAYGLYANGGGEIYMSGGSVPTLVGRNSLSLSSGGSFVSTAGDFSHAVISSGSGSEIYLLDDVSVSTEGAGAYGLYADDGGYIQMIGGSVSTAGASGHAVISSGSGSEIYLLDGVSVSTEGAGAYGLYADDGGYIYKDGGSVSTAGDSSHAVVAEAEDSRISISNADTVSTTGISAYGLYANGGGEIDMSGGSVPTLVGRNSLSLSSGGGFVSTAGASGHAVRSSGSGSGIYLDGVSLSTEGAGAYGLYADDGGYIQMTGGSIESLSDTYMYVDDGYLDLYSVLAGSPGAGSLLVTDSSGTVNAYDGTELTGNVRHTGNSDGELDLTLSGGSSLTGTVNTNTDNANAKVNVTLADNSAAWYVTGDSTTQGTLANAGTVDYLFSGTVDPETMSFVVPDGDYNDYKTVTVEDFEGLRDPGTDIYGTLKMKADINGNKGDLLYIAGTATGENLIDVQNISNSGAKRMDALVVEEDGAGSTATFKLTDPDGVVDAGAWNYVLAEGMDGTAKEVYLERNTLTTVGQGIVGSIVDSDIWYTEVDTLFSRLGMYKDGYTGGIWANAEAKKMEFDGGFGSVFEQEFRTISVGYDKKLDRENGALYQGMMIGYGTADRDITNGIGNTDLDSFQASLYSLYRRNDGFYLAGLLKYNRYTSDMTIDKLDDFSTALGLDTVTGESDHNGVGVSFMTGKRIETGNKGWYWEPQLQVSWMKISGDGYTTNSGIDVDIKDSDSVQARGGILFGRSFITSNGSMLDIYANASLVHEFDGETDVIMSGGKYTSDLSGTWGVYGIGLNWEVSKGRYLNARFQYADGDGRTQPWGAQIGFSFEM